MAGALKGAGDTRFVLIYSTVIAWGVWVPGVMVIVLVLGLGLLTMWMWASLFVTILAAGYLVRFRGGKWKSIEVIESPAPPPAGRTGAEALAMGD